MGTTNTIVAQPTHTSQNSIPALPQNTLSLGDIIADAMHLYPKLNGTDLRVYHALLEIGPDAYRSDIAARVGRNTGKRPAPWRCYSEPEIHSASVGPD